jgi:ABC-2 type transport system permease protein
MRQAFDIMKKEFKSYFVTPIAYIVISVFLLVTGWFFFSAFFIYNQASLRGFFSLLPYSFAFVIPAVAMRLFAEELGTGSYEILLTLPVSSWDVVLGKFFAALAFVAVMLVPTLLYPVTVSFLGDLDWGPVFGGVVGALFLGAAFAAIGLFASSLTRNQIIAYIIGMALCFTLVMIDNILFFLPSSWVRGITCLGADYHFQNIAKGVIDSRDILYFISVVFIALYATCIALKEKN